MSALLRRLRQERGFALPLALGVMVVTGAMVVSIVEYSSSSGRTANLGKAGVSAEAFAEAGLANAFAVLNYWNDATMQNNAFDPTLLGCDAAGTNCTANVSTYTGGQASWWGVLNVTTATWTITSVGEVTNPTGAGAVNKTLKATVGVTWNNTQPANAAAWNYVYSTKAPGSGCEVSLNANNVVVDVPLYIKGDLCFAGNNSVIDERGEGQTPAPQPIDLRVGGKTVFAANGTSIGVSGDNITTAAVAGGCTTNILTAGTDCNAAPWKNVRYFADTTTTFQAVTEPTADIAAFYQSASPGPQHPCVTAASPANLPSSTFETDNPKVQDGNDGTFNLTPATSYQCKTYQGDATSGTQIGELSWDAATHVLTIKGVVFIDKNVTSGDSQATYQGTAALYVGGTFTFSGNNATLCANSGCNFTTWNPNTEMLIVVANGAGNAFVFGGNNDKFQGGIFCNPGATVSFGGNNVELQGPIICGSMTFSNNVILKPLPAITELPLGAPGNPNVHAQPAAPVYGG